MMRRALLLMLACGCGCIELEPGDTVPPVTVESFCATCVKGEGAASCVNDLTASRIYAEMVGCGSEFQVLIECAESDGTCNGAKSDFDQRCQAEIEAFTACGGVLN